MQALEVCLRPLCSIELPIFRYSHLFSLQIIGCSFRMSSFRILFVLLHTVKLLTILYSLCEIYYDICSPSLNQVLPIYRNMGIACHHFIKFQNRLFLYFSNFPTHRPTKTVLRHRCCTQIYKSLSFETLILQRQQRLLSTIYLLRTGSFCCCDVRKCIYTSSTRRLSPSCRKKLFITAKWVSHFMFSFREVWKMNEKCRGSIVLLSASCLTNHMLTDFGNGVTRKICWTN